MNPERIASLGELEIFLLSLPRLEDRAVELNLSSSHFILLMMADTRQLAGDKISDFEEWSFKQGMVYLCAWGPDCSRVHDIADLIIVNEEIDTGREIPHIMTTWHETEPLHDALWFALNCANPDEAYAKTCKALLIIVVNNPDWEAQVRELLKKPDYFPD